MVDPAISLTLERCGLRACRVRLLQDERESVWFIDTRDAGSYALRIYPPRSRDRRLIESQCLWLRAIARDTELVVPEPISNLEDQLVTSLPNRSLAVLTRWVPGKRRFRRNGPGEEVLEQVGRIMATLHRHARRFEPPAGFRPPRWDWEGLFGPRSPWRPRRAMRADASQRRIIRSVMARARQVMRNLGTGPDVFGLIHGDLMQANYLIHGQRVHAIDFADFGRGYFLYDMAVTLLMLQTFDRGGRQRQAFLRGYRSIRPFSRDHEALLDTFIAIRAVVLARWVLGSAKPLDRRWVTQTFRRISV